jgi:ATP-dependent Clp protease protease subunit
MSAFAASAAAVGVRPPSRARAVSSRAPARAYGMASFSGLKAAPAETAIAGRRVATFADKVTASLVGARRGGGGARSVATMMPIGVPRVPYKTPNENSWQWVDIWNCLYRERIVWIGQTIDEELGNQLVATMLYLDSVDKSGKDIYLYINTEGGDIVPTMAILDTMKHIKSDVGCVAFGSARAMGGMLLACGTKGKRAALPNTCVMLHHPAGAARGQASDINNEGRELLKIRAKINQMVADATGKSVEQVHNDIRRDFHLTAEKALDYGVVDKVLYKRRGAGAR